MDAHHALTRWSRVCAHLICHSLGYATPILAARIVLAAVRGEKHYCEWISACYQGDPLPALRVAISARHRHHGYMADYDVARRLVMEAVKHNHHPVFASWF
jgi:hypothetical protein